MSFFSEVMRGYRAGRAERPAQHDKARPFDEPPNFRGDDVGGLLRENASLKAQLEQAEDERARVRAQMRDLEAILAFPGVRTALFKALHPDTGSGGSNTSRTEIFQTLMAVMERLGIRG
jgi:hypothetical protein